MSGEWMGVASDPAPADAPRCCRCGAPRPEGFRYLCETCSAGSVDLALRIEVAVAAMRERRVCAPVAGDVGV